MHVTSGDMYYPATVLLQGIEDRPTKIPTRRAKQQDPAIKHVRLTGQTG